LERLVAQRSEDLLEIVAVDCGTGDSSLELLRDAQATIVAVDTPAPAGIPLADIVASHVHGQVVVFLSEGALPTDERWLTRLLAPLDDDEALAAVSSRLVPSETADPLSRRDLLRSTSASREVGDLSIDDVAAFHVLATAVRSDALARFPLGTASRAGAQLWASSVLRQGLRLRHESSAAVFYSPHPSHVELLAESYQTGVGERESLGGSSANGLPEKELEQLLRDDWDYLERELGLGGSELEHWRLEAALRRALEEVGRWAGRAGETLGGVHATPPWVEAVGAGAAAGEVLAERP
jgi:rhamnosyltransferase